MMSNTLTQEERLAPFLLFVMEEKTEFDDIFRLYYTRLFVYAFQMIGTKEECQDIVNSAYEHVWMNFQLMDRSTVRSFLPGKDATDTCLPP